MKSFPSSPSANPGPPLSCCGVPAADQTLQVGDQVCCGRRPGTFRATLSRGPSPSSHLLCGTTTGVVLRRIGRNQRTANGYQQARSRGGVHKGWRRAEDRKLAQPPAFGGHPGAMPPKPGMERMRKGSLGPEQSRPSLAAPPRQGSVRTGQHHRHPKPSKPKPGAEAGQRSLGVAPSPGRRRSTVRPGVKALQGQQPAVASQEMVGQQLAAVAARDWLSRAGRDRPDPAPGPAAEGFGSQRCRSRQGPGAATS